MPHRIPQLDGFKLLPLTRLIQPFDHAPVPAELCPLRRRETISRIRVDSFLALRRFKLKVTYLHSNPAIYDLGEC